MSPRIKSVTYLDGYRLKLRFTNKSEGVIDLRSRIVGRGGVFKPLEDIEFFQQVTVDPISGTLTWPNEVDLCPDVLYLAALAQVPDVEPEPYDRLPRPQTAPDTVAS